LAENSRKKWHVTNSIAYFGHSISEKGKLFISLTPDDKESDLMDVCSKRSYNPGHKKQGIGVQERLKNMSETPTIISTFYVTFSPIFCGNSGYNVVIPLSCN
jgi:hypothetical protein